MYQMHPDGWFFEIRSQMILRQVFNTTLGTARAMLHCLWWNVMAYAQLLLTPENCVAEVTKFDHFLVVECT